MRVGAFALLLAACSQTAPPSPREPAAMRECVACGMRLAIVHQAPAVQPLQAPSIAAPKPDRLIQPELDAADLARKIGRPELEPQVAELIVTVQTRVLSAATDRQAALALDDFIADLDRLAHSIRKL